MSDSDEIHDEDAIVQTFLRPLARTWPGAFDLMDDCAILRPAPGQELVVKTDPIRAGVHCFADDAPQDLAWKALAVNVSDIASKGARPLAYTLALSFPNAPTRRWMSEFSDGLRYAQDAFGCVLIGGDIDRAAGPLSIAVTLFGEVPHDKMLRRTNPRIGDQVYVTGSLGAAAVGLQVRESIAAGGTVRSHRAALARYFRPEPRLGMRAALRACATAAMDISDGIARDLGRMCSAGRCSAVIELAALPVAPSVREFAVGDPELQFQLTTAGDDYEILCTVPESDARQFRALAKAGGVPVTAIGCIEVGSGVWFVDASNNKVDWLAGGYSHF
ncbi:MAG: thiamine-phosphate kinase [Hyphomicrobiaceae bacterium]